MDMADMGAIAALLPVPVAVVTAWWNKRSAERAADATLSTGLNQAAASLTVAGLQGRNEYKTWHRTQLGSATAEFLRAVDALIRTVRRLPDIEHERRHLLLCERTEPVEKAYGPLELIVPAGLLPPTKELRAQCRHLEQLALDRAVLRSSLAALEDGWCPGNAETCEDPHHNSAFVAWEFLTGWANKEDEGRWRDRDLLDYCLRESRKLSDAQVDQTVALADRCPAAWPQLVGGWIRDPLMERAESAREAFVAAARAMASDNTRQIAPG
ncbi:hypothetical protein ACIBK8_15980 [Streptomyces sp. NPDC050161]|uniref:hypothetical protein n=1 Tax=Streptomyces sp. NPDC050161 TaxID=3365604 RepID=UPI0037BA650F